MANIISADFNGISVTFRNDAYLNASAIAEHFGKRARDYLITDQTKNYIKALTDCFHSKAENPAFEEKQWVIVKRGAPEAGGGTWLHPKLAIDFARWLSPEFAVWCDAQIEQILGINHAPQIRAPRTRKALAGGLTLDQQETIKALHRELVKAAPEHLQAKLAVTLWAAIKSKFGVTYKAVPPEHYPEILSLMARVAQELPQQALPAPKPAHIIQMEFDTREDSYYHITIADGKAYRQRIMYASVAGDPYSPHNQRNR